MKIPQGLVKLNNSELNISGGHCRRCHDGSHPRHHEDQVTWHEVKSFFSGVVFGDQD